MIELLGLQRATRLMACYEVIKLRGPEEVTRPTASNKTHSEQQDPRRATRPLARYDAQSVLQGPRHIYEAHGELRDPGSGKATGPRANYEAHDLLRRDKPTRPTASYEMTKQRGHAVLRSPWQALNPLEHALVEARSTGP